MSIATPAATQRGLKRRQRDVLQFGDAPRPEAHRPDRGETVGIKLSALADDPIIYPLFR
jgi:hypothetical protein